MFRMPLNVVGPILRVLVPGTLLAAYPALFAENTANNDMYVQILSAKGILAGEGYAFDEAGAYRSILDRGVRTRFSPGIAVVAAGLKRSGLDPLLALVSTYPIVIALAFVTLVLALKPGFGLTEAAVLAFASMTTLVVLNSYRVLTSESYGFLAAIILYARVARGGRATRTPDLIRAGAALVGLSWVLSMVRNGSFLLVPGALLAYAVLKVDGTWRRRAGFLVVVLILSSVPLLVLMLAGEGLDESVHHSASRLFLELNFDVAKQFEVLVPRISQIVAIGPFTLVAGWSILLVSLAMNLRLWSRLRKPVDDSPATGGARDEGGIAAAATITAFLMALSYIGLHAAAAGRYSEATWAELLRRPAESMPHGISSYRVAGFSLPWAVIGCCGPLLLMVRRRPALRGLLISSLALLGLARYGLIAYIAADPDRRNAAAESRVGDYRVLADRLENRITEHLGRPEEVVVYNGSSTGRGVEYLLLYSAWIHRKPPWTLRIWGDDPDDVGAEEAGATGPVTRVLIIDENLARDPATGQLPEALVRHLRYARDHSRVPPARVMGVLILPMAPRPGQSATGSDGTSLRGRRPLGPAAGKAVPVAVRTARP